MRTPREVTLPLHVERQPGVALPAALVAEFRRLLADGVLRPGDELPSTRALAGDLGVSRGTVVAAYDQLVAEGWFEGVQGRSTCVNPRLEDVHPSEVLAARAPLGDGGQGSRPPRRSGTRDASSAVAARGDLGGCLAHGGGDPASPVRHGTPLLDLRPGRPMTSGVVGPAWRASWRRAADAPVDVCVPTFGWTPLRAAIADHLRKRALLTEAERVVVTSGARDGLALLLMATRARTVGVENPGYPSLRRALARFGVEAVPLPADDRGLVTADLPDVAPDLVIVTPSHQYPLGGSLPIDRRRELLAWASSRGVTVIEDDYDSELRYTSAPLPTLASLNADTVVLLGTFSKILTPTLAAGYLVVPFRLLEAVAAVRLDLGQPVGLVAQRALADYLSSGAVTRHTQRMRHLYRRRRSVVVRALRPLEGVRVLPMDGGLHAVVEHRRDEVSVIEALADRGVIVTPLSSYWAGEGQSAPPGLVFGFGALSDADLARALDALAGVLV